MYSREQIQHVRSSIDIVDVIREYVPSLKVAGRSVKGLCPFHHEKTPSFHVQPDKGFYKCFGCGASGDVINFLVQIEQVRFADALERLAGQAGVVLKKEQYVSKPQEESDRDKLFRVFEAATSFYEQQLWNESQHKSARTYLEKRGLKEDTIRHFRLGVAPSGGTSCFEWLVKKGFSIEICQTAGLVSRSKSGRFFDPLFGRIVFPIFDNFSHIVGFGGRLLPQQTKKLFGEDENQTQGPKYLNSPESPVFSKGRLLYGLVQGKSQVLADRKLVLMEGYMDVIGAHQSGFKVAVATLGTALTRDHARLIKRYADEVVAFFDPDEAGQKAALRSLEPLLQEGLFPRVVVSETDFDPDELLLKEGPEAFTELIQKAPDFVDYIIHSQQKAGPLGLKEKSNLAQTLLNVIRQSSNEILRSEWTARVAKELGLQENALKVELSRRGGVTKEQKPLIQSSKKRLPTAEEEFLQLLINCPEAWGQLTLKETDFSSERNQKIFGQMSQQWSQKGKLDLPSIQDGLEGADKDWFLGLTLNEKDFLDPLVRRDQLIRDIRISKDRKRLAYLSQQLAQGQADQGQREEYRTLLKRVKGSSPVVAQSR